MNASILPRVRRAGLRTTRGLLAVALTVTLAATAGVTAWASWSSAGSGSGSATTDTVVSLSTTSVTAPGAGAYPGGPAVPLNVAVTNPNAVPVQITAVTLDATRPVSVSGASGDCSVPAVNVSATGLSLAVAAGASGAVLTIPGALTLGSSTPSGCQGATFTVPVVLTGQTP